MVSFTAEAKAKNSYCTFQSSQTTGHHLCQNGKSVSFIVFFKIKNHDFQIGMHTFEIFS